MGAAGSRFCCCKKMSSEQEAKSAENKSRSRRDAYMIKGTPIRTLGSGYSKEQTKEIMLDVSATSLISPMSVIVIGGLNNDKYFTEEDLAYYKAKYGENSVDEKKSAKIK
eukprot:TRINITY_DN570_c0_g3_i5.p3 TRINITY_DN570_c0_g3~~TRINITY_DN570_c0_g3_i5.p3  ORF type:complete len:110 (-),score=38.26 TRINITY_DN570_c0_g3_i5:497-826(-)